MKKSILTVALAVVFTTISHAQYVSGVTVPDSTQAKVTDINEPRVKFANTISAEDMRAHLTVLASDEYEGRETGEPGNYKAANYIKKHFEYIDLGKKILGGDHFQSVAFTFSRWEDIDIFVDGERYKHLWDFLAFPQENESILALEKEEVIYLGFGIDDEKYSDYKKNDVAGKVILINKGEPMKKDSTYWITGSAEPSGWSTDLNKKLTAAKKNGVAMVLIIEDDLKGLLGENRRKLLGATTELGDNSERVLETANHAFVSTNLAKALMGKKTKKVVKSRNRSHKKGKACDVPLKSTFLMNMSKDVQVLQGYNVMGYIKGSEKPDEYIIVSAHYDHLGKRGDEIYNGADDNGSGTTTVLELAEAFSMAREAGFKPKRTVIFALVTGEEKGLLGSYYYVNNPLVPLENTVADVNIDMVGRVDEKYQDNPNYIYVIGSDRLSTDLHKINEEMNQKYTQLTLDYTYNSEEDPNRYYYRSDHYNFAKNGIPSIFFFNGTHADYHKVSDTVEKINFEKMAKVGQHVFHTIWELANRVERIRVDGEVK